MLSWLGKISITFSQPWKKTKIIILNGTRREVYGCHDVAVQILMIKWCVIRLGTATNIAPKWKEKQLKAIIGFHYLARCIT